MTDPVFRVLPALDDESGRFWSSGKDGRLRILRCDGCAYYVHPPAPVCPRCLGRRLEFQPVSGEATLYSYTVNHQPWDGSGDVYVIGLVQLHEQDDLRLTTNIVGVEPDDLRIGMPLRVVFEDHDPVYVPLFEAVAP